MDSNERELRDQVTREASREMASASPWAAAMAYPLLAYLCGMSGSLAQEQPNILRAVALVLLALGLLRAQAGVMIWAALAVNIRTGAAGYFAWRSGPPPWSGACSLPGPSGCIRRISPD